MSDVEIKTSFSGVKFMTCICRESKFTTTRAESNCQRHLSKFPYLLDLLDISAIRINRIATEKSNK